MTESAKPANQDPNEKPPVTPPADPADQPTDQELPENNPPGAPPAEPDSNANPAAVRLKRELAESRENEARMKEEMRALYANRSPWGDGGAPDPDAAPAGRPADGPQETEEEFKQRDPDGYARAVARQEAREEIRAAEQDRASHDAWRWLRGRPEGAGDNQEQYMKDIRGIIRQFSKKDSRTPWRDAENVYEVYKYRHGKQADEIREDQLPGGGGEKAPSGGGADAPSDGGKKALLERMRRGDPAAFEEYELQSDR